MHLCPGKGFVKRMVTCLRSHLDKKRTLSEDREPLRPRSFTDWEEIEERKPWTMRRPPPPPLPSRSLKPRSHQQPPTTTTTEQGRPPLPPKPPTNNRIYTPQGHRNKEEAPQEAEGPEEEEDLEDDVFSN